MEISQKYTVAQTDEIASQSGFKPVAHFFDKNKWFTDVIWRCVSLLEVGADLLRKVSIWIKIICI